MTLLQINLRSHIIFSAKIARTICALELLREAEVGDFQMSVLIHKNVLELQVTVHYALVMQMADSKNNLHSVEFSFILGQHWVTTDLTGSLLLASG